MSRPRKEAAARKSRTIMFRVEADAYDRLEAQANELGLSAHQLSRKLTCERSDKLVIQASKRLDPAYIAQLKKIGNNLNQLVKNAHYFKRVSSRVNELCDQIEHIIMQAIEEEMED